MRAIVVHSGGPTPVINASLAGLVEGARRHLEITGLYGALFGLQGLLRETCVDLFAQPEATLQAVAASPASALGTSCLELTDEHIDRIVSVCRRRDIGYLFVTGGNGPLASTARIAAAFAGSLRTIGIPKTIGNDLLETDHTPGYATAARFFACAVRDVGADNRALPGRVEFVEVLRRNTGMDCRGHLPRAPRAR